MEDVKVNVNTKVESTNNDNANQQPLKYAYHEDSQEHYSRRRLQRLQADICCDLKCKYCPTKTFKSINNYQHHLTCKSHKRRQLQFNKSKCWNCHVCNLDLPNHDEWLKHLAGKRHLQRLTDACLKEFPIRPLTTEKQIRSFLHETYDEIDE